MNPKFILMGAAGYVAPRHMKAIKEVGGDLVAIYDPHDSVGAIDQFLPDALYFSEFDRLDRWAHNNLIDYVSICSPNYCHEPQIRWGLKLGANVICEKPLVLNTHNFDALAELEDKSPGVIHPILQLRLHPEVCALKQHIQNVLVQDQRHLFTVSLDYCTYRGPWYKYSWKGDQTKSGGICTNIGIHLFDVLIYLFGMPIRSFSKVSDDHAYGEVKFYDAHVQWRLSTRKKDLEENKSSNRCMTIDDKIFDFTNGFTDLHTKSYQYIMDGNGFYIGSARPAIELVQEMRR